MDNRLDELKNKESKAIKDIKETLKLVDKRRKEDARKAKKRNMFSIGVSTLSTIIISARMGLELSSNKSVFVIMLCVTFLTLNIFSSYRLLVSWIEFSKCEGALEILETLREDEILSKANLKTKRS